MNTVQSFITSLTQLLLFSVIPFIWWFIAGRKKEKFLIWIGLSKPIIKNNKRFFLLFLCGITLFSLPTLIILPLLVKSSSIATLQFAGKGFSVLIPVLLFAFIQTSLSEEIFFRGFINKRLISRFGFTIGNISQSILFGLLHGVLIYPSAGIYPAIIVVVVISFGGWIMGYINEKEAKGSIIPSWMFHAAANMITSLLSMFSLI
jgi:membrane protease YdiL (CAAX protease family)